MRKGGGWGALPQEDDDINNSNSSNNNNIGGNAGSARGEKLVAETNANLMRALRVTEATNETGYATLQQLGRQKETIGRTLNSVEETRSELGGARQVIRNIRMNVYKEWAVKGCVLLLLLLMDIALFYAKFVRK